MDNLGMIVLDSIPHLLLRVTHRVPASVLVCALGTYYHHSRQAFPEELTTKEALGILEIHLDLFGQIGKFTEHADQGEDLLNLYGQAHAWVKANYPFLIE